MKMVHNGIEYGLMAAYAEGLNILKSADVGKRQQETDAETAPMEHARVLPVRRSTRPRSPRSGVAAASSRSWLLDLTAEALYASPTLDDFAGRVSDSGEGRWTSIAAIDDRRARARC